MENDERNIVKLKVRFSRIPKIIQRMEIEQPI
jgi:hypothetical protein